MKNKNFSSTAKSHFFNPLTPLIQKSEKAKKKLEVTFVAFFMRNHFDPF